MYTQFSVCFYFISLTVKLQHERKMNMKNTSTIQLLKIAASLLAGKLGSGILTFAIGLTILQRTESPLLFGISQMIGPLMSFLLLPFSGSLVDTYDKKKILLFSQSLSIIGLLFYSLAIYLYNETTLLPTYGLLIVLTLSNQFVRLTFTAATHSLVLPAHVQRLKSVQQLIQAISMLFIPLLAVWSINYWSLQVLVWIEILIEVIAVALIFSIQFDWQEDLSAEEELPKKNESFLLTFKEGITYVRSQPTLLFALFFALMLNGLFGAVNVGLPYLQINVLHLPEVVYGWTESAFAFGLIGSALFLSIKSIRYPLKNACYSVGLIGICFVLLSVLLPVMSQINEYVVVLIAFNGALSSLLTWTNIPVSTWMIQEIPPALHGRVFHLLHTGGELFTPLGILVFSFLFEQLSPYLIFRFVGIIVFLLSISYPLIMKIDLEETSLLSHK